MKDFQDFAYRLSCQDRTAKTKLNKKKSNKRNNHNILYYIPIEKNLEHKSRCVSRTLLTCKMEFFVTLVRSLKKVQNIVFVEHIF